MAYRYNTNRLDVEFRKRIQGVEGDTSPSLGGDLNLNNNALVGSFTAGEALDAGVLCCLNGSGKMVKADASDKETSSRLIGITKEAIAQDEAGSFYLRGFVSVYVFSPGDIIYVSTTAGSWDNCSPVPDSGTEITRIIGYAIEKNLLYLDPDRTYIEAT